MNSTYLHFNCTIFIKNVQNILNNLKLNLLTIFKYKFVQTMCPKIHTYAFLKINYEIRFFFL